jgi:high-affinity iron transporter
MYIKQLQGRPIEPPGLAQTDRIPLRPAVTLLRCFCCALLAIFALAGIQPAAAQGSAQMILHLLDYVGVDYDRAVEDGRVRNAEEFKEMLEFTAQVVEEMKALPANPRRAALIGDAERLAALVGGKSSPGAVAVLSGELRSAVIDAYKVPVAPGRTPDLRAAKALYTQVCAACHGAEGRGDGPAAKGMEPAPANFHDAARMASRGAYGLYNTITLGVRGTPMAAFAQLPEDQRWALAFFVTSLGAPQARLQQGEALWNAGEARSVFADLGSISMLSANEVAARHGVQAALVQDYLRAHPEVLAHASVTVKPAPIAFTRARLAEALAAYDKGERTAARQLAISAYLEGFELIESSLNNVDGNLRLETEREMMALRNLIGEGADAAAVRVQAARVEALLAAAEAKLGAGDMSEGAAFVSALLILLREGLEAILVLAAIIAFVIKTGRRDALPWVHAGWIAALVLGLFTWIVATYFIDISGANRELTEGVTALVAAAMLLYVGWWLHGKSYAQAWQRFLRDQISSALEQRTLWAMAGVSFLAVYREVFEIVLFYEALWVQAGDASRTAVLAGIAAAAIALAVIGWAILKYSLRLPLGPFFAATAGLLALLAVVFAGHGVAALQEAGLIDASPFGFIAVPVLGIHPTSQGIAMQAIALAIVIAGYAAARFGARRAGDGKA